MSRCTPSACKRRTPFEVTIPRQSHIAPYANLLLKVIRPRDRASKFELIHRTDVALTKYVLQVVGFS